MSKHPPINLYTAVCRNSVSMQNASLHQQKKSAVLLLGNCIINVHEAHSFDYIYGTQCKLPVTRAVQYSTQPPHTTSCCSPAIVLQWAEPAEQTLQAPPERPALRLVPPVCAISEVDCTAVCRCLPSSGTVRWCFHPVAGRMISRAMALSGEFWASCSIVGS